MTIDKIRDYFPQLKNVLYFNTGSSGPSPSPVIDEMMRYINMVKEEGQASPLVMEEAGKLNLRQKVAEFLRVSEDEIALTQSTSHGLGLIFAGLDWTDKDEIVVVYPEYISGMLHCQNVSSLYGVKLKVVKTDDKYFINENSIIEQINDHTKLVILSHVAYHNGQRVNVEKICKEAHKFNSMVIVDGAQSVGAMEINIRNMEPDFYVFPAQKWLLGEEGMGVLYVSKKVLDKVKPHHLGYNSVEKFTPQGFSFHKGARRFEAGSPSYASYFAFSRAIEFYNMIGEEIIFGRIEKLVNYLKDKLVKIKGLTLLSPEDYGVSSGLVSFTIDRTDNFSLPSRLYREKKIIIRPIPLPECLRISVHYFNTEEEIDLLVQSLS